MIPKIIHYCWFGQGDKPKLAEKCINSWKKYCPDYEIIEWNEDNFDVNQNAYTQYCYEKQKYAFLSDYARLMIIEEYGGIYFDTDVEVIKPIDDLLMNDVFLGFENKEYINTGLGFGGVAHHEVLQALIAEYKCFFEKDDDIKFLKCTELNTRALVKLGLEKNGEMQIIAHAKIYPKEYFNPYDDPTGKLEKTNNTLSIHWYSKSWMSRGTVLRSRIMKPVHRIFGVNCFKWIRKITKKEF